MPIYAWRRRPGWHSQISAEISSALSTEVHNIAQHPDSPRESAPESFHLSYQTTPNCLLSCCTSFQPRIDPRPIPMLLLSVTNLSYIYPAPISCVKITPIEHGQVTPVSESLRPDNLPNHHTAIIMAIIVRIRRWLQEEEHTPEVLGHFESEYASTQLNQGQPIVPPLFRCTLARVPKTFDSSKRKQRNSVPPQMTARLALQIMCCYKAISLTT